MHWQFLRPCLTCIWGLSQPHWHPDTLKRDATDGCWSSPSPGALVRLSSWQRRYVRPEFVEPGEEPQLHITGGRHPVLDALLDEPVVPNDTRLAGQAGPRAIIITGPNMGGKSCYIRQAALMAQACPSTMQVQAAHHAQVLTLCRERDGKHHHVDAVRHAPGSPCGGCWPG